MQPSTSSAAKEALKCKLAIDFIHQANPESVAPVCHLAGDHRHGIDESRLCGPYRSDSVSDFSVSIPNGPSAVRTLARGDSQNRTFCWLLHIERSSVSLLACQFSQAQHAVVPAMGHTCVPMHVTSSRTRRVASKFFALAYRHHSRCDPRQQCRIGRPSCSFCDSAEAELQKENCAHRNRSFLSKRVWMPASSAVHHTIVLERS